MARPRRWLSFRVDDVLDNKVASLCRDTGLTASEIARLALAELPDDVGPLIASGLSAARLRGRTTAGETVEVSGGRRPVVP